MVKKFIIYYKKCLRFISSGVWYADRSRYSRRKGFWVQQLRIFLITLRGMKEDKVAVHAAGLTFYTLMALVPIAATIFAIAKGFGFSDQMNAILQNAFPGQDMVIEQILIFAENTIKTSKSGWLGTVGVVFILWSVFQIMKHIEVSFNHVWQIKKHRSWARKFTDYLSVLLVAPFFFVISSSISLSIRYNVGAWFKDIPVLEHAGTLFGTLVPFALVYLMLTSLYVIIPNTRVKILPAFFGALLAGTLFQLTQNLYIYAQIGLSRYSAIYGAFAALPLLFIWINVSWQLVMMGAELSFAYQNVERYRYEMTAGHISSAQRKLAALLVMQDIARNFVQGLPPITIPKLSERLDLPYRLVSNTISDLQACRFIAEVVIDAKSRDNAYQPAIDVHKLTVSVVVHGIEELGHTPISKSSKANMTAFNRIMLHQASVFEASPDNKLLIEI